VKSRIVWHTTVHEGFQQLPPAVGGSILEKINLLLWFSRMYPPQAKGRFRRHRKFVAADWVVYYRVVQDTVYVRGLWLARMPQP